MDHGLDTQAIAVVAMCVLVWTVVSARAERLNITAPMAFVALGAVTANGPLAMVDIEAGSSTVRAVVEVTLAIVLFADASRLNLRVLRGDAALPVRLLVIGFPITVVLGMLVGRLVYPDLDVWVIALIASAVAPTDAALGAQVVGDRRVPGRIRRALNVESGLNDGLATPVVMFFIAGAVAEAFSTSDLTPGSALADLAIGVLVGVLTGATGGALLELARRQTWLSAAYMPIALLALALLAYAGAVEAGGNGFVASFVGGMLFGTITCRREEPAGEFVAGAGEVLSIVVWFVFGAAMVPVLQDASWRDVVYALLSLTVVRMAAVAVALAGTGFDRSTVLFMGWFGPRGLASVVFALIAFDELVSSEASATLTAITTVVVISVVAHGISAGPLVARYGSSDHPAVLATSEAGQPPDLPHRGFVRARGPLETRPTAEERA